MSRILLILIAVLALAGVAVWLATPSPTARGSRQGEAAEAPPPRAEREAPAVEPASPLPSAADGSAPVVSASASPASGPAARREASTPKDAELARAHWIDGRVLFPAGTPDDEEVFVTADGRQFDDDTDHRVMVERDGSFRVAFSEKTRTGRFELEARYLYLSGIVRWTSKESTGAVVLEPKLGARIAGRVRPPAGTDAASVGGKLVLMASSRAGNMFEDEQRGEHELSKGLDFAFDSLVPGSDPELTYAVNYDGEALLGQSSRLTPEAGEALTVELELRPGVTVAGVVRDEDGAPVEGAAIIASVQSSSGRWTNANWRHTSSAADGSFRLGALAGGEVELSAEHPGHEPLVRELGKLAEGQDLKDLALVLTRGSSIAGTVRWPDGSPAEATLLLTPHRTSTKWSPVRDEVDGKSDASGAFSISGLSVESYRVAARATKTEEVLVESETTGKQRPKKQRTQWSAEIDPVKVGTKDLVLTLSTGLAVSGRVVDDLGAPLEDFLVLADRIESGTNDSEDTDHSRSFRDTDGSFRMDGFGPGEWELRGQSKGHARSEPVRVTLPGGENVVLVVPRESIVRGRVLDPSGAPIDGASLEVSGKDGSRTISSWRLGRVRSDEHGFFEIDGLGPGRLGLVASGSGFAPSELQDIELRAGEMRSDIVLRLRPAGTILGELFGADGGPDPGHVFVQAPGFHAQSEADAGGRFEVHGVPPGEITLWARTSGGIQLQEKVMVSEGETVRVRLAPPGSLVRLHGRVRAGGEPLANARVHAMRADERGRFRGASSSSKSGEDGSYELELPGAGRYWLSIQGDDTTSLSWRATVDAPAVEAFPFDVSIPIGRISGRVTDADGQFLVGVLVQSEPERHDGDAHGSASALTDAEGRYELLVPAGQHAVRAGGDPGWSGERELPYAEARVGNLVVGENVHLRGVDLRLDTGGVVEGVVRLADGSGAGRTWVYATGLQSTKSKRSDEDGRFRLRLAAGSYLVSASSGVDTGCEPVSVEVGSGRTHSIEIALLPARLVSLTILKNGAPVGCELQVLDVRGKRQRVQSGENGKAWLGPLLPGRYTVRAQREGQVVERAFDVSTEEKEPKIELVFE